MYRIDGNQGVNTITLIRTGLPATRELLGLIAEQFHIC
jgi:hypothetical protein